MTTFPSALPALPDIPEDLSLSQMLIDSFAKYDPARVAIVDGPTGRSYSYGQLGPMIKKIAATLHKRGYGKGSCVAVFAPNVPEYPLALLGILHAGCMVTTVNPLYTAIEFGHQLEDSKATMIITVAPFLEKAKEAGAAFNITDYYVFGEAEGAKPFSELVTGSEVSEAPQVSINNRTDVCLLPYSSGTTGKAKGVMLTHFNIIANIMQANNEYLLDWSVEDVLIAFLPFFHMYGLALLCFTAISMGTKVVSMPRFDGEQFLSLIQEQKVTILPIVPPIALFLSKHPAVDKFNIKSIRQILIAAAPLGKDSQLALVDRLKVQDIRQGYGLTETSPIVTVSRVDKNKIGSCGVLIRGTEAKIVDLNTNENLGVGKEGEVCVRGPQIMAGYLNRPDATADCIKDGWFYTGDIGYFDEDGCLFIVDRRKELIKFKGFQVPPAELEELLISIPQVADAAVIGIPDEEAGELPRAYVVKRSEITVEEINKALEPQIAHYKRLSGGIEFVEAIPKSASGKILRRVLRDQYAASQKK